MPTKNVATPMWKICRRCKLRKRTATAFYRCPGNPDGVRSYCKPCGKIKAAGYAAKRKPTVKKAVPKRAPTRRPSPSPVAVS